MRIESEVKLNYSDVLFRPKRSTLSSRKEVDLERRYTFRNVITDFPQNIEEYNYRGVPIMAANMDGVGTIEMAETLRKHGMFTCLAKHYTYDDLKNVNTLMWENAAISTGITDHDQDLCDNILTQIEDIQYVCIDVANGYSEKFLDFVERFRERWTNKVIIAGNVVTPDVTEELILRGADIVKVGIGPGSVCTTRIKTGVGYPQLSAVIECADAAHGLGGHIIADGGCASAGDVAKAFGAGADFVMLGGMLAGTDQGGGEVITKLYKSNELDTDGDDYLLSKKKIEEKRYVKFYGMSSTAAQEKHGGTKDYRASEGRVVQLAYRGDVEPIIRDIMGGVRSACTYVGAKSLKELSKRTTFVQVNSGNQYNKIYENFTTGN